MNALNEVKRLADATSTTEQDDKIFQHILRVTNMFPQAVVIYGIVYLDGHGTLEAPPAPICDVASMLLKALEK